MSYFKYLIKTQSTGTILAWIWGLGALLGLVVSLSLRSEVAFGVWLFGWLLIPLYFSVSLLVYYFVEEKISNYKSWKQSQSNTEQTERKE